MGTFGNKLLILDSGELPKINGESVTAIYGTMETAYNENAALADAYSNTPDYYTVVCHLYSTKKVLKIKTLPKELADLFGWQDIQGVQHYVSQLSFRTSDSCNGSFTDDTMSFSGGYGKIFYYYRTNRWPNTKGNVFVGEPFEEKIKAVLGKHFKDVEVLPEWFDREYPSCYVRKEGGLNYPDTKLPTWRKGMPYVSNDYSSGSPNSENIRVFVESMNAHVYLQRVSKLQVGDEGLIEVDLWNRNLKHEEFCQIAQWSESKTEDPCGLIRWKVKNIKKGEGWPFEMAAMIGDKEQFTRWTQCTYYRIIRISYI